MFRKKQARRAMRQRASPCAYPHGDTGEGNDAHDAKRNLFLSMRGYVTKDLSTETGPSARILIAPRGSPPKAPVGASPAFLPAPAFPPTVPILQEGRAAFPPPTPSAAAAGSLPTSRLPSKKRFELHMIRKKQKSFGKAPLFRPCRLTSFGEPHIFAL